jgi:hypothetical protein
MRKLHNPERYVNSSKRKRPMNQLIHEATVVSDGVVIEFQGGLRCYFSADFLLDNINRGSNRVFLDYDPTPKTSFELPDVPAAILFM